MTFSPVIPSSYQSDRQDLMGALQAIVDAFIVSQSYAIGRQYQSALPDLMSAEGPLIVVGEVQETVKHDWQTRITTFQGTLFYVDFITDRQQVADRVDVWADHMRDLFTYNAKTVNPNAVLEQYGLQEGELTVGSLIYTAPSILFTYTVQGGYQ